MKNKIIGFFLSIIIVIVIILPITTLINNIKNKKDTKTIKVAEVTHSIFYTPFYVAIENNYFKDEGLDIELILTSGSDNVAASVISNDTQIGLAGPESAIFVYTGGEKDYLQVFSGLTKRDGQFILSRKKDFKWDDLKNKEILVGRSSGMPAMSFMKALENEGINKDEVNINTSIEFAELSGAFIGKTGDYVNLFEPLASKLENEGLGYVVSSVGLSSNEFPYTAFYARKEYIENNKVIIKKFTRAIKRGLKYTNENSPSIIANKIKNQFKDTKVSDLSIMIERYKKADVWMNNTTINKEMFNNLINLLKENNLLKNNVYYKDMILSIYD